VRRLVNADRKQENDQLEQHVYCFQGHGRAVFDDNRRVSGLRSQALGLRPQVSGLRKRTSRLTRESPTDDHGSEDT
jgi:hypothetical protein